MNKRILPIVFIASVFFSMFSWNCTKLDISDVGSDQIPAVDNVHTFADTLTINTSQGIFNDTTTVVKTNDLVLGAINNDPLFGKTSASIYFQFKPTFYPYYFGNDKDTINGPGLGVDSVVLCLKFKSFWGDTMQPLQLEVREVVDNAFKDSIYKSRNITYAPNTGSLLATATVDVRRLGDTVKYTNRRDYSVNMIRIKLPFPWAKQLYDRDSSAIPGNNAFSIDSIFRFYYNGLAVVPVGGGANGLMYVNLADTSSKLEVHFRKKNKNGILDTVYQSLILSKRFTPPATSEPAPSSVANYINRNIAGFPVATSTGNTEIYLQTTPGSYANLNIPGLSALDNRIIHRAEIIVQQIPNNPILDEVLSIPTYLYIDLRDTTVAQKWKPVYFDLSPNEGYNPDSQTGYGYLPSNIDYLSFGGFRRNGTDKFGNAIKYYNFNISRYVQQIVTKHTTNYNMRLYAPYEIFYPQFGSSTSPAGTYLYGNRLAAGRVKIGGGSNINYRLILRIVYSKI